MNYETAAPTAGELNMNYEDLALDMNYEDSALNNFAASTENCPNCSSREREFDNSIAGFCFLVQRKGIMFHSFLFQCRGEY